MKKIIVVASMLLVVVILICSGTSSSSQLLRIHIRANSNEQDDQDVKYIVKQAVVGYLVPYVAECNSLQQAMETVDELLPQIKIIADNTLQQQGYSYTSTVSLCQELFPTRVYDDITVASGVYDALIIELGSGEGDNWWCVVYPPLCFVGSSSTDGTIVYQSKLLQIIDNWLANR